MIIAAVIPLFEYHIVPMLWKTKKIDLVTMAVTFLVCFYETEMGIFAGVAVALIIFIYESVQLKLAQETDDSKVTFLVESQSICYPNIDSLISKLEKMVRSKKFTQSAIVLDMKNIKRIDSTAALALKQFSVSLKVRDVNSPSLLFRNVTGMPRQILANIGIYIEEEMELDFVVGEDESNQAGSEHANAVGMYPKLNEQC